MSADEMQIIKESLSRIEVALMGDPKMGNKGIVVRLSEVEAEARANTAWRETVKAKVGLLATGVSLLVAAGFEAAINTLSGKK